LIFDPWPFLLPSDDFVIGLPSQRPLFFDFGQPYDEIFYLFVKELWFIDDAVDLSRPLPLQRAKGERRQAFFYSTWTEPFTKRFDLS
jgi:hypothetical protein